MCEGRGLRLALFVLSRREGIQWTTRNVTLVMMIRSTSFATLAARFDRRLAGTAMLSEIVAHLTSNLI
jgi:hypothetical protein